MRKKLLFAIVALFLIIGSSFAKKIAFIDQNATFGLNGQGGIVTALTSAGYQVTTIDIALYPGGTLDFTDLATYDLVVISKACSSSMFSTAPIIASWAAFTKPYITLTPYLLRANRLNLVNTSNLTISTNLSDVTTITKAIPLISDPVLSGVTTDLNPFDYFVGFYETINIAVTGTTMDGNSGKVIVALNTDAVPGPGLPLLIRWEAGSTYPAGVTNAAARTYLGIGSDAGGTNNYNNFTPQSLKLFMNEVQRYAPLPAGVNDVKLNNKLVSVKGGSIQFLNDASSVEVYNSLGAKVSAKNNISSGNSISLNHAGVYVVKMKSEKGVEVQKLIVQ